jgi:hypothetical protein
MQEINAKSLFTALAAAQKDANKDGRPRSVKIADHAKKGVKK